MDALIILTINFFALALLLVVLLIASSKSSHKSPDIKAKITSDIKKIKAQVDA